MHTRPFLPRFSFFLFALNFLMVLSPSLTLPAQKNVYPVFNDFPLPKSVSICGEPMPLENRAVFEMIDREFNISVWDRAQVILWLKRAGLDVPC